MPVKGRAFCSLSFRISGQVRITGKHNVYQICPQSVFYMPAGYDYTTRVVEGGQMYIIHFWAQKGFPEEPFVWRPDQPQLYERMFSQLVENIPLGQRKDLGAMGQLYRLLAQIRADSMPQPVRLPKRMLRTRSAILGRFNESDLSISELAREAGLSEAYFRREFKACFGCQPVAYISHMRIEHAKALLEAGDCSVSEAAIRSGYDNVSYFSYRFRCVTGMTPGQYRDSAEQRK